MAGFCTSVTVCVLPVLVVTIEMVGLIGVLPSFMPPLPPPRLMRLPPPSGVGRLDGFCRIMEKSHIPAHKVTLPS